MSVLLVRTSLSQAPPTLVTIAGEIDIATVPALRRHLLALPNNSTVVDLSGVHLLAAAGVTELVDLRDRLAHADMSLALAAARPLVRRVLAISGIDGSVLLTDTVEDATHLVEIGRRPPSARAGSTTRSCGAPRRRSPQPSPET